MLSGNENKFDLTQGGQKVNSGGEAGLVDVDRFFSKTPPVTFSVEGVANTVIGPPSNIAIRSRWEDGAGCEFGEGGGG